MQTYLDFLREPLSASEIRQAGVLREEYDLLASELKGQSFTFVFSQTLRDQEESLKKWKAAQEFIREKVRLSLAPSLDDLSTLHRFVGGDGEYRVKESYSGCDSFLPAQWVPHMMMEFEKEILNSNYETFEKAARAYQWINCVHPFSDGNGHVASLVRDWILALEGFLPATGLSSDDSHVDVFPEQSRNGAAVLQVLRGSILTADILKNGSTEGMQR